MDEGSNNSADYHNNRNDRTRYRSNDPYQHQQQRPPYHHDNTHQYNNYNNINGRGDRRNHQYHPYQQQQQQQQPPRYSRIVVDDDDYNYPPSSYHHQQQQHTRYNSYNQQRHHSSHRTYNESSPPYEQRQHYEYSRRHHHHHHHDSQRQERQVGPTHTTPSDFYDTKTNVCMMDDSIACNGHASLLQFLQENYANFNYSIITPEIEYTRARMLRETREKLGNWIRERFKIDVPKESFNRWLLERKVIEKMNKMSSDPNQYFDPLLPSICMDEKKGNFISPSTSESLAREVLDDIPLKVNMFPKSTFEAKRSTTQYLNAAQKLCKDPTVCTIPDDQIQIIDDLYRETIAWMSQITDPQAEKQISEKLEQIKKTVNAIFREHLKEKVDKMCIELAELTHQQVQELKKLMDERSSSLNEVQQMSSSVRVRRNEHKGSIDLSYQDFFASIHISHYNKLLEFYSLRKAVLSKDENMENILKNRIVTNDLNKFHDYVLCLLIRYQTFFGGLEYKFEGSGLQAALPERVFSFLRDEFNVSMECFASPLNCFFPNFCSAFPDIDHVFGSVASFFEFEPTSGSFEANPPFAEELMIQMVRHMEKLLDASTVEPLSFIVIVPNWTDAESLQSMHKSKFLRKDCVLEANKHGYVNGFQHNANSNRRNYTAVHETHIYFLQNEAAFAKWTPTDEKIRSLMQVFSGDT